MQNSGYLFLAGIFAGLPLGPFPELNGSSQCCVNNALFTNLDPRAIHPQTDDPDDPGPSIDWWQSSFQSAEREAKAKQRPLLLYFWMENSAACTQVFGTTLQDDQVGQALAPYLSYGIDVRQSHSAELMARFGVQTVPSLLFLTPEAVLDDGVFGTIGPAALIGEIQRIQNQQGTLTTLRKAAEASPDDLNARLNLSIKLRDLGCTEEAEQGFQLIRSSDPKFRTQAGARLRLNDLLQAPNPANGPDIRKLRKRQIKSLWSFVERTEFPAVAIAGYTSLVQLEQQIGNRKGSRKAARASWTGVPQDLIFEATKERFGRGRELAESFWNQRKELESIDVRFGRDLTEELRDLALTELRALESTASPEAPQEDKDQSEESYAGLSQDQREQATLNAKASLGDSLNLVARFQWLSGQKRKAKATIKEALSLHPERSDHLQVQELFAKGE